MWAFIVRKLFYYTPVYLSIILLMMLALRVNDPVNSYLGKNATPESIAQLRTNMGLDDSVFVQYVKFLGRLGTLDFSETSWAQPGQPVRDILLNAIPPSLSITIPMLAASTFISIVIALISAYFRGRTVDRTLMVVAVLGMSVSFLVYIIFGQFFGAFYPRYLGINDWVFEIQGYSGWLPPGGDPMNWISYCLLPVIIGVIVSMGYDTRFYRAVMVEETTRDYIVTALAKGAGKPKVIFVHMLKNAMIPVITRIMASLPFMITGALLLEMYFSIPGMGRELITAIRANDFPVIQAFVAVLAAIFVLSVILTDVLYALVDPRVKLS